MNIRALSAAVAVAFLVLPASPAKAATVTFVSIAGSGTACTRTAPCSDFPTAYEATASRGLISCLDAGQFEGVNISKSITIDCPGTYINGFGIVADGIVVRVRNAIITQTGFNLTASATLIIEHCLVQDNSPAGIFVAPSGTGAQLVVINTVISNNFGSPNTGGGIIVNPQVGGSAVVSLDGVTVADNVFGIAIDGSRSTAGIAMVVRNSTVHRNTKDGIVATTIDGQAPIGLTIKNTASVSNNIGIRATGPGVTVRADGATVMHNGTGLVVNNGAPLLSFGNNNVEANGTNGAFSGPVTLK